MKYKDYLNNKIMSLKATEHPLLNCTDYSRLYREIS